MELEVRNVIYNPPATIVFWNDDTKTVVKTTEGEDYNPMYGVLMAYYQKHSGMSKTQTGKFMDKVIKDAEEQSKERNKVYIVPKFKIGDRVIVLENVDGYSTEDMKGIIAEVCYDEEEICYAVKFDENMDGWGSDELGIKEGFGYYIDQSDLKLIK